MVIIMININNKRIKTRSETHNAFAQSQVVCEPLAPPSISLTKPQKTAVIVSSFGTRRLRTYPKKISEKDQTIHSIGIVNNLKNSLESGISQKRALKLFFQMGRKWQYRAMFLVWKSHREPSQADYGRNAIGKSVLCLLDKLEESGNQRIIDLIIEEMTLSLAEKTLDPLETPELPKLSFRSKERADKIDPLQQAILEAEIGSDSEIHIKPISLAHHFSRITNLQGEAHLYTDSELNEKVRSIMDLGIACYLRNPWEYLKRRFFPDKSDISVAELDQAAKDALMFSDFSPLNFKVIEHPSLPGWVFKGNTSQVSCIRNAAGTTGNNHLDHLNRVSMSEKMRAVVEADHLLFDFPRTYLIDTGISTEDIEKRYLLVQEKIPILSHEENVALFAAMPADQQLLYAQHLCHLILKTGYSDAHFGNMTLVNGKLYIYDEEALGALVEQGDTSPHFDRTLDECAAVGLQRMIDCLGNDLPVFRVAAENALIDLREKWVFSKSERRKFASFMDLIHDLKTPSYIQWNSFQKLDPLLKSFLASAVAKAVGYRDESQALQRIEEQPAILSFISNHSGVNLLEQIQTSFEIQSHREILRTIKQTLIERGFSQKSLAELKRFFDRLIDERPFFDSLRKRIGECMETLAKDAKFKDEKAQVEEFCSLMLRMHLRGSSHCLWDELDQSLFDLKRSNSLSAMRWRMERATNPVYGSALEPTPARPVSKESITAQRLPECNVAQKLNVTMIAYECAAYGLKFGGLGEAVYGMAKGLEKQGHKVTILLPKFDKLPSNIQNQMNQVDVIEQPYLGTPKQQRVLGFEDKNISLRYLEDTLEEDGDVDHYSIPDPRRIYEDGILVDSEEPWVGLKKRMAHFSNSVSEYIMAHPEIEVVVFHDWHSAYAMHQISHRYFEPWSQGKTPATVFVIHNNSYGAQGVYSGKAAKLLPLYGDQRLGMNVMLDALKLADQNVTVSPNFAYEIQQSSLGAGIDPVVRQIAHQDKLTGICNGSNPDLWNPADNTILKNWIDPVTKEPVPLNFSPNDPDLLEKKTLIKIQLQKALEVYYPDEVQKFRINLRDKDLILYVGRYDSSQKGLDQLCQFLRAAHQRDVAFVAMGVGEDVKATEILDALEQESEQLGNAWITRGREDGFSMKMQLGNQEKGIPGLGPLLRAAAVFGVAPSSFEPGGLVQFEAWLFGSLIIATATGGLADTIISDPENPLFNGFLFERLGNWESSEQGRLAYETALRSIDYWRSLPSDQKTEIMQRVMKSAQGSSWSSSPSGLTPVEQYERVFGSAIETAKRGRGIQSIDLIGSEETRSIGQDHYFGLGTQVKLYETYGAHLQYEGNKVTGVRFQLMAPGAESVHVVMIENLEEHFYPMENCGGGNWKVVIPSAKQGTIYQYEILDFQGKAVRKADPFAFASELRPKKGSIVHDYQQFEWTDGEWMQARALSASNKKPYNIYEVHLGSWRRNKDGSFKNYRELAHELSKYCQSMHYTHIELLGISEHPSDDSWGYQVSGFFAPTSRHGTLHDFQYFVNYLHAQKLGVILDFVPYHFAPDEWGLRAFSGVNLFENLDPINGETPRWGTRTFDFAREDVRNFLLSSAHLFLTHYHIDGLRVDAAGEMVSYFKHTKRWVPNEEGSHWNLGGIAFLRSLNTMIHGEFSGVVSHAENSKTGAKTKIDTDSIEIDGLGFDRRWNMSWMGKALRILEADPVARKRDFRNLCALFESDWQMKHLSSLSHDEVVHGKRSLYRKAQGSIPEKIAQVKLNKALQAFFPASGMLSFMGNEFAQDEEWNFNGQLQWSLIDDPGHRGVFEATRAIHAIYLNYPCLWDPGVALSNYEQIHLNNKDCVVGFRRKHPTERQLTIIQNFSNKSFPNYKVYFPKNNSMEGLRKMKIIYNTDAAAFAGGGMLDGVKKAGFFGAEPQPSEAKGFELSLPAFSAIVLEEKY